MAGLGSNKSIILDYLNEDCWRLVFQYVSIQDLIRTEHASRRWQQIVLVYFRSLHFCIIPPDVTYKEAARNVHTLQLRSSDSSSFEMWSKKLGSSVVSIYCDSEDSLRIIDNCPNLEHVMFIKLTESALQKASQKENFKHLQRAIFKCCPVSDHSVSQFLANNALQQLEINNNDRVTGRCLINLQPNILESLILKKCYALETHQLIAAAAHLKQLKKMLLLDAPQHIYNSMHTVLEKMPKLECLYSIVGYDFEKRGSIFTAVSRLCSLKYLYVNTDVVTDQDLELVTERCRELRVLWLERCNDVTARGVAAICRNAGERLIALCLWYSDLEDDDVALIVRSCPNLKSLDLYGCLRLTARAAARAAGAGRSLRLRTADVYCQDDTDLEYAEELKTLYPKLELYYHDFKDRKDYDMFWNPG